MTEKERKKREAKLRKELETPYKKWLNEDVAYIITDEERKAFKRLQHRRRARAVHRAVLAAPRSHARHPGENEFKEEHYRRIAYANERFASGIPGWKTDRGRIYITFGPPDEIESHPSGGTYERPIEEGGGTTSTYPFEQWRYRYIEGIGNDINIEFVDPTMTGEYRMTMDPSEKDALLYVPNAGLTMMEQMGLASKTDRFSRTDGTHLGTGNRRHAGQHERVRAPGAVRQAAEAAADQVQGSGSAVNSTIKYNLLPMKVRADFIPVTGSSVLTNVTLQFENKDLQFQQKEGVQKAAVNIYARITTMSRRVVNVFEDAVTVEAPSCCSSRESGSSIYQKSIPLAPGMYRLNVVAKDIVGGNMNNYEMALNVPHFDDEKLASSSLILADLIEKVPTRASAPGSSSSATSKVRPRLNDTFRRDEKMGIYLQLYNFGPDEKTQKPNGSIDYEVTKNGTNEKIFEFTEDIAKMADASQSGYDREAPATQELSAGAVYDSDEGHG